MSPSTSPQTPSPLSFALAVMPEKRHPPQDTRPSFAGQTILVTGANTGLGLEASVKFAQLGAARLILAVRNPSKGEAARSHISANAPASGTEIEVWELDMLSYPSILAFAARVRGEFAAGGRAGLDVAVLNAGVMPMGFERSAYGFERTVQVNVLSTVLLGLALIPILKRRGGREGASGGNGVLELVGSTNHYMAKLLPEAREERDVLALYSREEKFAFLEQYNVSKLFLMYAQTELVKIARAEGEGEEDVHVVVVCPGATTSDLGREGTAWHMVLFKSIASRLIMKTTEQGARTYISGATLGETGNGKFWSNDQIKDRAPLLVGPENEALQKKVWQNIVEALKKDVPGIEKYIRSESNPL